MDLISHINAIYAISGLAISFLVGFTGVGGGSLMTPLLMLLFHVSPATAVGTDLLYAGVTRVFGTAVHGARGTVDWRIVGRMAAGSVPASALTLLIMAHFHAKSAPPHGIITYVLGGALILSAAAILFRRILLNALANCVGELAPGSRGGFTIALGAVVGLLVSLSSVGAGAIGVTVLLLLYPKLPAAKLVGSDIAHAVPLTLLAGFGHWLMGDIDFTLLGSLLVGAIPGIVIGSWLSSRAPDAVLRQILASTLALVGGRLFF
ncbi:MAG: sulfite exporter TauE/SafE family protein [Caulobacteraceae bacterium]